jgi:hypothetical protein
MIEKITWGTNFRCNDALAEIDSLGILASIENKNPDFKMIDQARRIAGNYPIIDVINLYFFKKKTSVGKRKVKWLLRKKLFG